MSIVIERISSSGLTRLKTPSTLNQAAVAQLREAIVSGALRPGSLLKDAEVAAQLGLSATPVREALVQLAAEGLVEIEPNRLKRVAPIDYQAMVELLQVQNRLWAFGYAWGGPHIGVPELKHLRSANAVLREAIASSDPRGAVAASHAFHLVVMQASGNRELVRVSVDRVPLIVRFVLLCSPSIVSRITVKHHEAMRLALERGDVEAAIAVFETSSGILLRAAEALRDGEQNAVKHRD